MVDYLIYRLNRYMQTKQCKVCNECLDLTMFNLDAGKRCIPCHKIAMKKYRDENKEKIKAQQEKCRANKSPEKILAEKERRMNNPELKKKRKDYYEQNKKALGEKQKAYVSKNKDAVKERSKKWYDKKRTDRTNDELAYIHQNWTLLYCAYIVYESDRKDNRRRGKRNYYHRNKEKSLSRSKKYATENMDTIKEYKKKYRIDNIDKIKKWDKEWRLKNQDRRNYHNATRRCNKLNVTPPWITKDDKGVMVEFYKRARELSIETGIPHHVDHIFPLKGKDSMGLHVPWNLRIITETENVTKGNRIDISLL